MMVKKYNAKRHSLEPKIGRLASPPFSSFSLESAANVAAQVEGKRFEDCELLNKKYEPDTEIEVYLS